MKTKREKLFEELEEYYKKKTKFKYNCICLWSKDDKYGFIPNVKCPVHGKKAKKILSKCVDFEEKA